jgi:26S proteasome regulatory subunit (ATPase 3-interacting protein)
MRVAPTDAELATQIEQIDSKVHAFASCLPTSRQAPQITKLRTHIEPLRSGTPLVSSAELDTLDAEWTRWRAEWICRRKVFYKYSLSFSRFWEEMIDVMFVSFWALVADSLSPHDAEQLAEDLGIEHDTPEHVELERGPLCGASKRR